MQRTEATDPLAEKRVRAHLRAPSPSDVDAERGPGRRRRGKRFESTRAIVRHPPHLFKGVFERLRKGGSDSLPHGALRGGAELGGNGSPLKDEHDADVSEIQCLA